MTSIRIRRCTVCADVYEYQLSGHGCLDQKVDDRHCSYCLSIIQEAVKNIKVKFECRYESIYDMGKLGLSDLEKRFVGIDAQVLLKWESDWKAEVKSSGKLFVQRVWPGLMNLQTNDFQHIRSIRGPC
jgi:copper chaperone CopZ